ncbi:MAG TPA: hypothetical protein VJB82_00430 [Candidatus Peribacterales bacterium]|nr:hypothetical protein [Candidatus Peribacterales bacterium]
MVDGREHLREALDELTEIVDIAIEKVRGGEELTLIELRALERESAERGGGFCGNNPEHIQQLRALLIAQQVTRTRTSFAQNVVDDALDGNSTRLGARSQSFRTRKNPYSNQFMPKSPDRRWNQIRRG